nr:hypothetical protein [uncultured Draconibacterium sp.]
MQKIKSMDVKNIFISWSKLTSKKIAEELLLFLRKFFCDPNTEFFHSERNIEAGDRPFRMLDDVLAKCNFGILVLTERNFKSEWLMFEAGALSKNVEYARVISINFNRKEIESPINNFQNINYNKDGISKLLVSLKKYVFNQKELTQDQINDIDDKIEKYWSDFDEKIKVILANSDVDDMEEFSEKVPSIMMDEEAYEKVLAKREVHLQELIETLSKDNSERIIILGGISTTLRSEKSIKAFAKWLIDNPNSKLFICYENIEVAINRAKDLRDGVYDGNIQNELEIIKRKVDKFNLMKEDLLSTVAEKFKKNIFFIEIIKPLSVYVTIQERTMYLTPVLDKRSSNTFTFKLKETKLIKDVLDYMMMKIDNTNPNNRFLLEEIEKIKLKK